MNDLTIHALQLIESVGDSEPFRIVPVSQAHGKVMTADEVMTAKIRWVQKAGYRVVTKNIPQEFWPFNAVIRIHASGTEDQLRDYLAEFREEAASVAPTRSTR